MQLQRERDTAPEMALRRELDRRGLRHRVDLPAVPGTSSRRRIEIAFTRAEVAVFVDGRLWHGLPHARPARALDQPGVTGLANRGNRLRDADTNLRPAVCRRR